VTPLAPHVVYLLCLATSIACSALLARSFKHSRDPLLLWSAAAFALFAVNNFLLVADLIVFPSVDLWMFRQLAAAAGISVLLIGFIWKRP
jgi:hypothetical protein